MSNDYSGLGRGLDALIPRKHSAAKIGVSEKILGPEEQIAYVDPLTVSSNPHQPRKHFEHSSIEDLVNSIREHGILQPLIVSKVEKGYQLISGERRLRAASILEMDRVPVIVRKASEQEKLALALIENIQRQDLNPIERAWGYSRLIEEFNLTQEEASKKVGQSRVSLTNSLRLLKLSEKIQKALIDEIITEGHAKVLLGVEDGKEQQKLFHRIIKEQLSVRTAEHHVRSHKPSGKKHSQKDPNIVEIEERLQQALGTKVDVIKGRSGGTIVVHFYSSEELKGILNRLTRSS